jgi:hypothetical protein
MWIKISLVLVLCLTGSAFGQAGALSNKGAPGALHYFARSVTDLTVEAEKQPSGGTERREFRLLATNKTSTMQKEMNEAADNGFRFAGVRCGLKARGHPLAATGISQIVELCLQLRGMAEGRQVAARVALAQSIGGLATNNWVMLVEARP